MVEITLLQGPLPVWMSYHTRHHGCYLHLINAEGTPCALGLVSAGCGRHPTLPARCVVPDCTEHETHSFSEYGPSLPYMNSRSAAQGWTVVQKIRRPLTGHEPVQQRMPMLTVCSTLLTPQLASQVASSQTSSKLHGSPTTPLSTSHPVLGFHCHPQAATTANRYNI